jgi:hypothetical protein
MEDESARAEPEASKPAFVRIPIELATMFGFAIAILGVVATGSAITAAIREPSPWLVAAAYGGPSALAFGLYWAIAQRL